MSKAQSAFPFGVLFGALVLSSSACSGSAPAVDEPYESCILGDVCNGGLYCQGTTLPISSGYSGNLCTSGCNSDNDCLQLVQSYDAVCVNAQCYLTCPASDACPYSQGCFTFDSPAGLIGLCTP